jgi:hypothetical protein
MLLIHHLIFLRLVICVIKNIFNSILLRNMNTLLSGFSTKLYIMFCAKVQIYSREALILFSTRAFINLFNLLFKFARKFSFIVINSKILILHVLHCSTFEFLANKKLIFIINCYKNQNK